MASLRWTETLARPELGEVMYESESVRGAVAEAATLRNPGADIAYVTVVVGEVSKTEPIPLETPEGAALWALLQGAPASRDTVLSLMLKDALEEWRKGQDAYRRARRLLRSLLTPEQRQHFDHGGYFYECGRATGAWYRFKVWGNTAIEPMVRRAKRFRRRGSRAYYCLHPDDRNEWDPIDVMIGQLLILRSNERRFLAMANFHTDDEMPAERARAFDDHVAATSADLAQPNFAEPAAVAV